MNNKKVTAYYNGKQRTGTIVESKKDKVKIFFDNPGNYKIQTYNWFDISDVTLID